MDTRLQSALTKTTVKTRAAKKAVGQAGSADVSELFLAELAERRVRLQELLTLIRTEAARELAPQSSTARHRACRPVPAMRVRNDLALRAANTD